MRGTLTNAIDFFFYLFGKKERPIGIRVYFPAYMRILFHESHQLQQKTSILLFQLLSAIENSRKIKARSRVLNISTDKISQPRAAELKCNCNRSVSLTENNKKNPSTCVYNLSALRDAVQYHFYINLLAQRVKYVQFKEVAQKLRSD